MTIHLPRDQDHLCIEYVTTIMYIQYVTSVV